jgi:hypothetical protein
VTDTALYAVYLGGPTGEGRMGEDHEVVFVVGSDPKDVRRRARAKWGGAGRAHVDAVRRIERIDGHEVRLVAAGTGDVTDLDPDYYED